MGIIALFQAGHESPVTWRGRLADSGGGLLRGWTAHTNWLLSHPSMWGSRLLPLLVSSIRIYFFIFFFPGPALFPRGRTRRWNSHAATRREVSSSDLLIRAASNFARNLVKMLNDIYQSPQHSPTPQKKRDKLVKTHHHADEISGEFSSSSKLPRGFMAWQAFARSTEAN